MDRRNPHAESKTELRRELGLRDMVLFNVAAIVSIRWIATAAHAGSGTILLWVLAAAFFLVPSAFVTTRLSQLFPEEGGLYIWTREAFGEWHGFACAWFYYINNLFWIPGVLVFSVGMITYSLGAQFTQLAQNPTFVIPCALVLLVLAIGSNYVGLRIAKWVDNFGGIGSYAIWIILVASAIVMCVTRGPATRFELLPSLNVDKLNFWSQLAFGMTGLELSPILSGEIRNPKQTIFKATWISAALVVLFYVVGTGGVLTFLQPAQISPVIGLAEAGRQAASLPGFSWVPFAIAIGILLSIGGQLGTYVGAGARLPFVLGVGNLLPPAFARLHPRYRTPHLSILFLGVGAGVLLLLSQLGETFRAAYQITIDMSVITLFIPFLYIFGAAWKFGQRLAAFSGFCVSLIAIAFSFIPTPDVKFFWLFELKLVGSCVFLYVAAWLLYRSHRRQSF
jgi:amino acid transporter